MFGRQSEVILPEEKVGAEGVLRVGQSSLSAVSPSCLLFFLGQKIVCQLLKETSVVFLAFLFFHDENILAVFHT